MRGIHDKEERDGIVCDLSKKGSITLGDAVLTIWLERRYKGNRVSGLIVFPKQADSRMSVMMGTFNVCYSVRMKTPIMF